MNERRSEAFAASVERLLAGERAEAVLADHPEPRDDLAGLLRTVEHLRAECAVPAADYRRRSRAQLVALANDPRRRAAIPVPLWRLVLAGGLAALVLGAIGWTAWAPEGRDGAHGVMAAVRQVTGAIASWERGVAAGDAGGGSGVAGSGAAGVGATGSGAAGSGATGVGVTGSGAPGSSAPGSGAAGPHAAGTVIPAPTVVLRVYAPRPFPRIARDVKACPDRPGCPTPAARPRAVAPVVVVVVPAGVSPAAEPTVPVVAVQAPPAAPPVAVPAHPSPRTPELPPVATPRTPSRADLTPPPTATTEAPATPTAGVPPPTAVVCAAAIAGTVRDLLGDPVVGARVTAFSGGGDVPRVAVGTATVGVDGTYRIVDLCAGAYVVAAQWRGPIAVGGVFDADHDGRPDPVVLAQRDSEARAVKITVSSGQWAERAPAGETPAR